MYDKNSTFSTFQNLWCKMCEVWSKRRCGWLGEKSQRKGVSLGLFRLRRLFSSAVDGGAIRPAGCPIALQGSLSRRCWRKQYLILGRLRLRARWQRQQDEEGQDHFHGGATLCFASELSVRQQSRWPGSWKNSSRYGTEQTGDASLVSELEGQAEETQWKDQNAK